MFTCFIYDLDPYILELINLILNINQLKLLGFSSDLSSASIACAKLDPDIIFADAKLIHANADGFSAIAKGRILVYTSEVPDYAYHAYQNHAVDYILKPFNMQPIIRSVKKIQEKLVFQIEGKLSSLQIRKDSFFVKTNAKSCKTIRIRTNEVFRIEALENYVTIHLESGQKIVCYLTLKEIEEQLPKDLFSRINKSNIINHTKIQEIEGNTVVLANHASLSVGPSFQNEFFARIDQETIVTKRHHRRQSIKLKNYYSAETSADTSQSV